MYLSSVEVTNLRCFEEATLVFPDGGAPGWHVILGGNGAGKSSLLQAMALVLVGPLVGQELVPMAEDRARMVRHAAQKLSLAATQHDAHGRHSLKLSISAEEGKAGFVETSPPSPAPFRGFSAGYGPFRRLSGGSEEDQALARSASRAARHITLFRERAALTRCEEWLTTLYAGSLDKDGLGPQIAAYLANHLVQARRLIDAVLPNGMSVHSVTTQEVRFQRRDGMPTSLSELSDGYRSFLAMVIDLLRHILDKRQDATVREDEDCVDVEGVVLIDEADAHLHPEWQRHLGERLCQVFPKIQFVVTSHSPLIAASAKPGGLFVLRDEAGKISVDQPPSVEGWTADQILLSPLFGLHSTRDPETEQMMAKRLLLLGRSTRTEAENRELEDLTTQLRARLSAPGDSLEERDLNRRMMDFVRSRLGGMP